MKKVNERFRSQAAFGMAVIYLAGGFLMIGAGLGITCLFADFVAPASSVAEGVIISLGVVLTFTVAMIIACRSIGGDCDSRATKQWKTFVIHWLNLKVVALDYLDGLIFGVQPSVMTDWADRTERLVRIIRRVNI